MRKKLPISAAAELAGISINDLLNLAVSDEIYLGATLGPFKAEGRDYAGRKLNHAHWRQIPGKPKTCMLPHEAEEILLSGTTTVHVWREPGYENGISIPQLSETPVVYFLCEPQTVGRDVLWVYEDELPQFSTGVPEVEKTAPVPTEIWREKEILRVIAKLGHVATSLPASKNGTGTVKATVKLELETTNNAKWSGTTVFDKAWDRLRGTGRVAEAGSLP